jgi:pilus assembly protein CpaB
VVSAVTLELAPEDAEKLDLARSVGTLSLVLRNQLDKANVATAGVTKVELLRLRPVADAHAPAPAPAPVHVRARAQARPSTVSQQCVEVIRGGTRASECF